MTAEGVARPPRIWHGPRPMRWSNVRFAQRCTTAGVLGALLLGSVSGCKSAPEPVVKAPPPPAPTVAPPPAGPEVPPMLPASVAALLDDENVSPYFARRGDDGLLLYSSHGRWQTRAVGPDGTPRVAAPLDVAPIVGEVPMAALKAAGDGYLAVWVEVVAKNHLVKMMALDIAGKALGEPTALVQSPDELTWLDVLPNAKGALVLWEIPHEDRSELTVTPIMGGRIASAPATVVRDVIGWEAIPTERGVTVATVVADGAPKAASVPSAATGGKKGKAKGRPPVLEAPDPQGNRGDKVGRVFVTEIDAGGKAGAPIAVSDAPTAQVDVEIVEVDGRYVLAWTDERDIDACVFVASLEPGGKLGVAPHRATSPFGEQALVSLVASPFVPGARPKSKRALLAWEDLLNAPHEGRLIHLATLGPDTALGPERASLAFSASGPPDIVPDGDGFTIVTLAPVAYGAPSPADPAAKEAAPVLPTYVRLGPDLTVLASEPVRAEAFGATDGIPYLTRNLSCQGGTCTTLASAAGANAALALVSLPVRKSSWRSPAWREADEAPPRASTVSAIFDGDDLARVAATDLPGGGSLAAWVTYFLDGARSPAGGEKKGQKPPDDGPSATLGIRPISAANAAGKTVILSHKAMSIGGVAVAAAPGPKQAETAVAWVAKVKGEPQVFVTKVGADGTKLAEKGVTVISRKRRETPPKGAAIALPPSEASDVAIAYAGGGPGNDGWVVAWVDTRDGNPEIYAAKVDRSLNKIVPDHRITSAPGDSSDVQMTVRGNDVFLAWSDARQNPEEGNGDIYLARLDLQTLKKDGNETRLFASAMNSRSPSFTPLPRGFLVSWIEEPGDGKKGAEDAATASEKGLRIAQIDEKGGLIGVPQLLRGEGTGTVTSAALGCGPKSCRGVLTSVVGEALVLDAFEMAPGAPAGPLKAVAALTGGVTQDVSPVFSNQSATSLFFADDAVGGAGRVRWMQLTWP
jgi:hypothetical protein